MLQLIAPIATAIVSKVADIIREKVEDTDKANELIAEIQREVFQYQTTELVEQSKIILAEIQGESWLQRNWRPILMLTVVAIVANNYLLAPYLNALFGKGTVPFLELPEKLWNLMTVGVGGYVVGRSAEKVTRILSSRNRQ